MGSSGPTTRVSVPASRRPALTIEHICIGEKRGSSASYGVAPSRSGLSCFTGTSQPLRLPVLWVFFFFFVFRGFFFFFFFFFSFLFFSLCFFFFFFLFFFSFFFFLFPFPFPFSLFPFPFSFFFFFFFFFSLELGFIPSRWDLYSELMMMYLLGMGSQSYPLNSDAWMAWKRTVFEYDGLRYIGSFAPLFVHQYFPGLVRLSQQA